MRYPSAAAPKLPQPKRSSRSSSFSSIVTIQRTGSLSRSGSRSVQIRPNTATPIEPILIPDVQVSPALDPSVRASSHEVLQHSNGSEGVAEALDNAHYLPQPPVSNKTDPQPIRHYRGSSFKGTSVASADLTNGLPKPVPGLNDLNLQPTKDVLNLSSSLEAGTEWPATLQPPTLSKVASSEKMTLPTNVEYITARVDEISLPSTIEAPPSSIQPRRDPDFVDGPNTKTDKTEKLESISSSHTSSSVLGNVGPGYIHDGNIPSSSRRSYSLSRGHSGSMPDGAARINSVSPTGRNQRRHRNPSQKAMLSKALQKANTAVVLDNAANFEGAMDAYSDACYLLQQVMLHSNGSDDERLKLREIRDTYMVRISELQRLDILSQRADDKALPQRPVSNETLASDTLQPFEGEGEEDVVIETATAKRIGDTSASSNNPTQRQSLATATEEGASGTMPLNISGEPLSHPRYPSDKVGHEGRPSGLSLNLAVISRSDCVPAPLSPRRPFPSNDLDSQPGPVRPPPERSIQASDSVPHQASQHARDVSNGSSSWLNTIDESTISTSNPSHARSSDIYLRRKYSRRTSNETEAAFDAALDAAVEAAYNEGLEPTMEVSGEISDNNVVANARRNIELAKQRVREAEREAEVAMARGRAHRRMQQEALRGQNESIDSDYVEDEAEEEERLLEEMTKGYTMDEFEFDLRSKSVLPRQSDSSSFSNRTWGSSVVSNSTTAGTSLSTLPEDIIPPLHDAKPPPKHVPPPPPIPSSSPPAPPPSSRPSTPSPIVSPSSSLSVRTRRMSGQNLKQLKIETGNLSKMSEIEPRSMDTPQNLPFDEPKAGLPSPVKNPFGLLSHSTPPKAHSKADVHIDSPAYGSLASGPAVMLSNDSEDLSGAAPSPSRPIAKVPSAPGVLRKNMSSSSLRGLRTRNISASTPDIATESPSTPSSISFPSLELHRGISGGSLPALPTPTGAIFPASYLSIGGSPLFDNIHSPSCPGSPNPMVVNPPVTLEPCPESFLLRPFWLMRCLYQTIIHPRGGYLSTRLFIPRDVWGVKNVRIRGIDEKISHCDLLTAALLKLVQVDINDADAVLEEMQTLDNILDQVQASLSKRLGNEVGAQGVLPFFKSPSEDGLANTENFSKTSSGTGKLYLSSWRRLRSKTSGVAAMASMPGPKNPGGKDKLTLNSLPMTATPNVHIAKKNVTEIQFIGPNAHYMGALARLFDAVQVLDQIARQVEDPGLRHSSLTHVGLELSTRHAAEFFGFYICRFALNDIGMMLDKFIKRSTEWVLT